MYTARCCQQLVVLVLVRGHVAMLIMPRVYVGSDILGTRIDADIFTQRYCWMPSDIRCCCCSDDPCVLLLLPLHRPCSLSCVLDRRRPEVVHLYGDL